MIDKIYEITTTFLNSREKKERKQIGQFFTSIETAAFMASLFEIPSKDTLSILDPGAGTGILTAALVDRLQTVPGLKNIHVTCYENDPTIIPILNASLDLMKEQSIVPLSYTIIQKNYILSQFDDFNLTFNYNSDSKKYDLVIGNPPYKKIPKDAPEAKAMQEVCHGAPNLYFLFSAMSLFNLIDEGQLVYIIPRSWTSGAYFRSFREYLLKNGVIDHIHLFESRDKVFDNEKVLQETIIIKLRKTHIEPSTISISTSNGNSDFHSIETLRVPYSTVVSSINSYIFLFSSKRDLLVIKKLSKFKFNLLSLNMKMKTGLTVDFRCKEELSDTKGEGFVPLFYPAHLQSGRVKFPIGRSLEFIDSSKPALVQANRNYLFVKRFTSKEEKRRLQCSVYLAEDFPDYQYISTQNKLNFIDSFNSSGLEISEVYGLYVIFNSSIYDEYYRILNGSTQVNSTEINTLPLPSISTIQRLGELLKQSKDLSVYNCDKLLEEVLYE
ncbi:MAG TPA: DNA methyltransferase [Proteiniclasticum sp.]|uniref:Eco57I restriction-modification methylase domain-containing protein n=1 Tax=Proteiniclasticum sp. TaxID=2053595 RepID=UPI000E8B5029|nr:Eco57I restriction-modification methylase domain-containing protein [Proteiniclasticum sp.]HBW14518.1 DNA methyltransferase [Proteiniclasticum sp.]